MEQRNEPTTEEIVATLRKMESAAQVVLDSGFGTHKGEHDTIYRKRRDIAKNAADRLERQEQTIAALTARAEQAERERDAAIKDITRLCTRCKHWTCPNDDEPCLSCLNAESGNPNWTWRGLPQEGEGK